MTITDTGNQDAFSEETFANEHIVQFSENDSSLLNTVSTFISAGLCAGDACIVIATKPHREKLEQLLKAGGLDITPAQAANTCLFFDAATTLSHLLVNGQPDPVRFEEIVGRIITQAKQGQRRVRIFGEMVALLWAEGNHTAAIRLEDLWNDLGKQHSFSLLCGYSLQDFGSNTYETQFAQICHKHSQIIPPESYNRLSEEQRFRAFVVLQQKAYSLETEIAERKAVQKHLRSLAAIVESSDDAILSKDLDGIITSWNRAAERIYGYSAQEMIGHSVLRIFPPKWDEEFHSIMERLRRGERIDHYETRRMRKDGVLLIVSVTISPVKDESGTIIGASAIARDITEQRRLEAKSQRLFASNLVGIFVADSTGTLLEANQAFLNLMGYTQEDYLAGIMQQDISSSPTASFLHASALKAGQKSGNVDPVEIVLQHKNGKEIPVLVAVTSIEHTETCIGFVLDISERKELEQRKDAFIGMASHELKTPVTSLKGFLGLLQRLPSTRENEKALHYLARMDAQLGKLTQLINDLLDISKMQTGHLIYREERVLVDDLVQEIVESIQETTQTHSLQLESLTHAEVFGDRDRLGQVLINLLNNAIKYSPNANTIIVRLAADKDQVVVSVQDFGLGIAQQHHQKIFERFYQVTDSEGKTYPGLGIGLSISYEIVRRHGGRLWVESQKGTGATFHLSLPRIQQEGQSGSEEA